MAGCCGTDHPYATLEARESSLRFDSLQSYFVSVSDLSYFKTWDSHKAWMGNAGQDQNRDLEVEQYVTVILRLNNTSISLWLFAFQPVPTAASALDELFSVLNLNSVPPGCQLLPPLTLKHTFFDECL